MAFDVPLLDTSSRQKILNQANQFALSDADIQRYQNMLRQQSYQGIAGDISQQFTPAMRMAQNRLGASPLLADSGYANRLNRQLQTSAFGDLTNRYQQQASSQLQQLIQQRLGERQGYINAALGGVQKKRTVGDYAAGIGGAALGAWAGGGFK